MPEDHQVHWGTPPTTGDSPLGPNGVLGLGETGKGMNLGEVRVDRTSVAYLVHAVRGGGPVGWLTAFGEGETVRSSPRSGKGNGPVRSGPEPTAFGEGERSGAHRDSASCSGPSVWASPTCLLTGHRKMCTCGPSHSLPPLTCRGPSTTPVREGTKTGGENHKSPRDCPCPRVDSLRRTLEKKPVERETRVCGSPLRPAPETPPVLPSVGTAEGAGERRDRARPL